MGSIEPIVKLNMASKSGKGAPSGGNGKKLGQKMQKKIAAMLMAMIGFAKLCLGMKKKSEEGNPVLRVTPQGDSGREYLLTVSDPAEVKTLASEQDRLAAIMSGQEDPNITKANTTGLNKQVEKVMKLLSSLQNLERYANMVFGIGDSPNQINLIMPDKKTKFNFSMRDLKRLVGMANNATGNKRMEQMNEIDFCIKLLAMQGQLEVGKTFNGPSLVVVYKPNKKAVKFHEKKVMYCMTMENGIPTWKKGNLELVARDKRGKVVFWTKINKELKNARFVDKTNKKAVAKDWFFQIKQKHGKWVLDKKTQQVLQAAKEAGVLKGYSFGKEWADDIEAPVKKLKYTLAGFIMSTTNAVSTGVGHIVPASLRDAFCKISLKRLLEGHPDEVSLLNEENTALLGELKSLLILDDWKIPAIFTTNNSEWSPFDPKNLSELMDSGLLNSVIKNDVKALSNAASADQLECVPHARLLNRYWKWTEVASTWTASENHDEMIDLVSVPAQEPAQKSAE